MENYRNTIKILSAPPWAINNGLSLRPAEIFGQLIFSDNYSTVHTATF